MKRLRVRLKASGPEELAATFGHRLRPDGLDIPSKQAMDLGQEVSVTLLYKGGTVALEGTGRVEGCEPRPRGGFALALRVAWSPISRQTLARILPELGDGMVADLGGVPAPVDSTADVLQIPSDLLSPEGLERMPDVWQPASPPPPSGVLIHSDPATPAIPADALESGEVTPLARIELVRPRRVPEIESTSPVDSLGAVRSGSRPREPRGQLVLGVDFGTREIRTACMTGDETQVVPTRRGMSSLPSVVHIDDSGKTIVGEPALRRMARKPEFGMRDARRLLGFAFYGPGVEAAGLRVGQNVSADEEGGLRIGRHEVLPEEVTALLLKEVREASNLVMPDRINRAVLTAPTWSGPETRGAVIRAAEAAGFHVERVIGEAAACAVSYGATSGKSRALVVSMGAGVLDVALVSVGDRTVEVLASAGSTELAGCEFDRVLRPVIDEALAAATAQATSEVPGFALDGCTESLKESLGLHPKGVGRLELDLPGAESQLMLEIELERTRAEALWAPLVEKAVAIVEGVLESAGGKKVDALVLAGGGLGLAPLRRALRSLLPEAEPVELDFDAAANGAAIIGARIARDLEPGLEERLDTAVWLGAEGKGRWSLFPERASPPSRRSMELPVDRETRLAIVLGSGASRRWVGTLEMPPEAQGVAELEVLLTESLTLETRIDGQLARLSRRGLGETWYEQLEAQPNEGGRSRWLDWFRKR
ncbi:MAG: Hsp70 family protein [Myxococcota bacterium]